jgi:D-xylose transport system permease protein
MVGVTGMFMALLQQEWLPRDWGFGYDTWWIWIVTVIAGLVLGALIGGLQGSLVAYIGIPSFVVTLGGLLVWRAVTFVLAQGRTISPLDSTFMLLGGGPKGAVGDTVSWIIGIAVCVAIVYGLISSRRRRRRFDFPTRPVWAEVAIGAVGCIVVYQILFSDVQDHLREYATLKAIGLGHTALLRLVGVQAGVLALSGTGLGVVLAAAATRGGTELAPKYLIVVTASDIAWMGVVALLFALVAGLAPARYLANLDPATAFRR